jgi:hypothetical protein
LWGYVKPPLVRQISQGDFAGEAHLMRPVIAWIPASIQIGLSGALW